jgi:hypothetical protein
MRCPTNVVGAEEPVGVGVLAGGAHLDPNLVVAGHRREPKRIALEWSFVANRTGRAEPSGCPHEPVAHSLVGNPLAEIADVGRLRVCERIAHVAPKPDRHDRGNDGRRDHERDRHDSLETRWTR